MNSILPDIIELEKNFSFVEADKEKSGNSTEDVQDTESILNKLKENLEAYELESENSFNLLKARINSGDYTDLLNELELRIKKYDFENALVVLNKLFENFK